MPKKRKRSARIAVHAERGDRVVIIMVMITMMIMTINSDHENANHAGDYDDERKG